MQNGLEEGFSVRSFESGTAIIIAFLTGVATVLVGVVHTFLDAKTAYEIVQFDVLADE